MKPTPAISAEDSQKLLKARSRRPRSQEARVSRNLLNVLPATPANVASSRTNTWRAFSSWPNRAGHLRLECRARFVTFALDECICATGVSYRNARVACALLLHGAYADVDAVLAAMTPGPSSGAERSGVVWSNPAGTNRGRFSFHRPRRHLAAWMSRLSAGVGALPAAASRQPEDAFRTEIDEQIYVLLPSACDQRKSLGR